MQTLGLGITLFVIGLILSIIPLFGVLGGPLMYIGWILILIGIVLGIYHFVTGRNRYGERTRPPRTV
jgi:disulfide bond formation protein DsbB